MSLRASLDLLSLRDRVEEKGKGNPPRHPRSESRLVERFKSDNPARVPQLQSLVVDVFRRLDGKTLRRPGELLLEELDEEVELTSETGDDVPSSGEVTVSFEQTRNGVHLDLAQLTSARSRKAVGRRSLLDGGGEGGKEGQNNNALRGDDVLEARRRAVEESAKLELDADVESLEAR